MEENKYYTPELKEFHVGFECEFAQWVSCGPDELTPSKFEGWRECLINRKGMLPDGDNMCMFRVKYLDKDDIEELGFIYDSDSGTFKLWSDYEMYELETCQNKINIERFYQTKLVAKILPFSEWKSFNIFNGIIKNKSELKDILEKLGI